VSAEQYHQIELEKSVQKQKLWIINLSMMLLDNNELKTNNDQEMSTTTDISQSTIKATICLYDVWK